MEVAVTIPTYGNRPTMPRLLDSLLEQSFKKFNVLIIFKPSGNQKADARALATIKSYDELCIEVAKQKAGRIEEAMNIAFSKPDADIILNTDDDAQVSKNWVKDHVELHKRNRKVGIATGRIVEENPDADAFEDRIGSFLNRQKWRLNKHTIIDPPIDPAFKGYGMYVGVSGMLVDTGKTNNMSRTLKQHGVNMSWKKDALDGFKLPGFTKGGGGYEPAAALEAMRRGYAPIWFDKAEVYHPRHASMSRGETVSSIPSDVTCERVLFSYYASKFYKVDLNALKLRTTIDDTLARLITGGRNRGYRIGYGIARLAIEGRWKPQRVRELEMRLCA